jgi:hypothetical protein
MRDVDPKLIILFGGVVGLLVLASLIGFVLGHGG